MKYIILAVVFVSSVILTGCTQTIIEVPAPKQFDCGDWNEDKTAWFCRSRVTGKCIKNQYVNAEACNSIPIGE